ncbi:MAG: DsrE family protein [Deltaproteobacteria bacterium]|nr:DsrE family protein [Deltaproteobacteria bacterium]
MQKMLTLIVRVSPYSGQGMATAIHLAEAALDKGHRVHIHAAGDGVYAFRRGQGTKGMPTAEESVRRLLDRGLGVDL